MAYCFDDYGCRLAFGDVNYPAAMWMRHIRPTLTRRALVRVHIKGMHGGMAESAPLDVSAMERMPKLGIDPVGFGAAGL